jgi:PqqD family protein of HPr-rel-A system
MPLPTSVTVPENVFWQRVGDEVVLLDAGTGEYHALNDTGSAMWQALEQCPDVASALESLREDYEVEGDRLAQDLEAFVAELLSTGLLAAA